MQKWSLDRKDKAGSIWKLAGRSAPDTFVVRKGQETVLAVGEPVIGHLSLSMRSGKLYFNRHLRGRLGELAMVVLNGQTPLPKLLVRNQDGSFRETFPHDPMHRGFSGFAAKQLPKGKGPFLASMEYTGPFKIQSMTVRIGANVHLATHPIGVDKVELVWQINDRYAFDGSYYRTHTAAFVAAGQEKALGDKSFQILASLDGAMFTKIATVAPAWATNPASGTVFILKPTEYATIADVVWDEPVAGHVAAGSFGKTDADILADTNELQADWVDAGRLDALLDAIKAVTDNLPDSGALNDLGTLKKHAEADRVIDKTTDANAWRVKVKESGTENVLITKLLKDVDGAAVASTDTIVGQEVAP